MTKLPPPRNGYRRLDIRPSPKLTGAINEWVSRQDRPMPMAGACRTLLWLALRSAGVASGPEPKRLRARVEPVLPPIEGKGLR
jgi:hypothetical protein